MFGYVLVNKPELKIKEFDSYRSWYCGLCRALNKRHGLVGRLTLNYDMTFLIMILADLYDENHECDCKRCLMHPMEKHCSVQTEATDYCADMCVLLAYYKCKDDWKDEHRLKSRLAMALLSRKAKRVAAQYPEKASFIEKKMNMLDIVENAKNLPIVKNVCAAHRCEGKLTYTPIVDPTINDEKLSRLAQGAVAKTFGEGKVQHLKPVTGGEDFSEMMRDIPGTICMVGVRNPKIDAVYANHHGKFKVDEAEMVKGAGLYAQLAVDYLDQNAL